MCFEAGDLTYHCGSILCCCAEGEGLGTDVDFFLFAFAEAELCPLGKGTMLSTEFIFFLVRLTCDLWWSDGFCLEKQGCVQRSDS